MKEVAERINILINDRKASVYGFSKKVGINQTNLGRKLKGTQPVTKLDVVKICKSLGVNEKWLVSGEGDKYTSDGKNMLAYETTTQAVLEKIKTGQSVSGQQNVPYYDIDFQLGFDAMYNDSPNIPTKFISVPGYDKADFWINASGNSMMPIVNNGDVVALKEVSGWDDFLPLNEMYAVVTKNDLRTIKVIRRGADDDHFCLHAYNEDYDDQEIEKSSITRVFKVLGVLKTM